MSKFRSGKAFFLSAVLTAGFLLSAIHFHEPAINHSYGTSETGQEFVQDYNSCPLCSIIYKSHLFNQANSSGINFFPDYLPLTADGIPVKSHFAAKTGRSPPLG